MDKFKAMQTAVSIADQGSLTAAATALNCSLPAVVRNLAALESHLGVRLFNRTTRSISLTDEGRVYIENCREWLANIHDIEATLHRDADAPRGLLTLTAPVQFGQLHVAPAVTRFVQQYPQMQVRLLLLDQIVNLVEENIDVGIRIGTLADSSMVALPLGEVDRLVVASPAYLRQHPAPEHPKDLLHANCIRFTGSNAFAWNFYENGHEFTVPVRGNLEFNQIAPTIDACLAGLGFGMFISYQVKEHIRHNRLQAVLHAFQTPPRPISIIYPCRRQLPARTKVFVEWMQQELQCDWRI